MILGLDISTAIIGLTIIKHDGSHYKSTAVKLPSGTLSEKALFFEPILKDFINVDGLEQIWIEEPFQRFAGGGSTAATMMKLATFNGMCQFMSYKMTGILPDLINANSARKLVGLKIKREKICGISTKDQVLNWTKQKLPNYGWPTKTLKSGPRKGLTIDCPSCYDIADSFVIANAGFIKSASTM